MGYPLFVLAPDTAQLLLPLAAPVSAPYDPRLNGTSGRMTLRGSKFQGVPRRYHRIVAHHVRREQVSHNGLSESVERVGHPEVRISAAQHPGHGLDQDRTLQRRPGFRVVTQKFVLDGEVSWAQAVDVRVDALRECRDGGALSGVRP